MMHICREISYLNARQVKNASIHGKNGLYHFSYDMNWHNVFCVCDMHSKYPQASKQYRWQMYDILMLHTRLILLFWLQDIMCAEICCCKCQWGYHISMALCKTAVTPVHQQWSYCSLALSHRYVMIRLWIELEKCVIHRKPYQETKTDLYKKKMIKWIFNPAIKIHAIISVTGLNVSLSMYFLFFINLL